MPQVPEQQDMHALALDALRRLFPGTSGAACRAEPLPGGDTADAVVTIPSDLGVRQLLLRCRTHAYPALVTRVGAGLCHAARARGLHPALTAPYLSPATLAVCRDAGIAAWDLCGNAALRLPGVFVLVEGKPNVFTAGEPTRNVFAPKASRLLRVLLTRGQAAWRVTSLAQETGLTKGYVSRLVSELTASQMAYTDELGVVRLLDPGLLLDQWARRYRPSARAARRYFLPFDAPARALDRLNQSLASAAGRWAATGPAAADLVDPYLRVADLHLFWSGNGDVAQCLTSLKPAVRGANVFVFRPYDEFVYYGKRLARGIPVVSDLQLYLDLSRSGGRAAEYAARFRDRVLRQEDDAPGNPSS